MTYLYPGFTIGIVGQYQGGHLRAGREAVLVKHRISEKILLKRTNNCLLTTWTQTGVKYGVHGLPIPQLTTVRGSRYHLLQDSSEDYTLCPCRLLEYEQPGSVTPAKHCQVEIMKREGFSKKTPRRHIERSSVIEVQSQLRDLWDLLHVYVAPSKESDVAGEGLYVRRKIPRWGITLPCLAMVSW